MNKQSKKVKLIVYNAMAIALVTLATLAIRVPTIKGYVNFGDIMIFVLAAFMGSKTGLIAGGIGSCIADLIGYPAYAPATLIIKGLEGLICGLIVRRDKDNEINILSFVIACVIGASVMVLGYFTFELFAFGKATAMPSVPSNIFQGSASAVSALPIVLAIKKSKVFKKILGK